MKKNKILSLFLLSPLLFLAQRTVETEGYITFPKCQSVADTKAVSCNRDELMNFITTHLEYPKEMQDQKIEGQVVVRYILSKEKELTFSLHKNNYPEKMNKAASEVMQMLKNAVKDSVFKVVPGRFEGKYVNSYYLLPINFKLPKEKEEDISDNSKKIVVSTYKTIEKTVQFRRDLKNNIYAYLIQPKKEKLLIKINGDADMEQLTEEQQSYFFLYNLTFLKPEILLSTGSVEGKEYEIFIDKNSVNEGITDSNNQNIQIKVYTKGVHKPVDIFQNIEELFNSKYVSLIFK